MPDRAKRLLPLGMGEQLHRLDVGVGVDHPAGDQRVGVAELLAHLARPWARATARSRRRPRSTGPAAGQAASPCPAAAPAVASGEGRACQNASKAMKAVSSDAGAGIHHAIRQPPGEVVLEERHGLAQQQAVRPPVRPGSACWSRCPRTASRVQRHGDRPQPKQQQGRRAPARRHGRPERRRPGGHQVDDAAGIPDQPQLQRRHRGAGDGGEPDDACGTGRRCSRRNADRRARGGVRRGTSANGSTRPSIQRNRRVAGRGQHAGHSAACVSATSSPRNPPDCRAQSRA